MTFSFDAKDRIIMEPEVIHPSTHHLPDIGPVDTRVKRALAAVTGGGGREALHLAGRQPQSSFAVKSFLDLPARVAVGNSFHDC